MSALKWAFKPDNFNELSDNDKFNNVLKRLELIEAYVVRKRWRERYASPEQFEEEYPEDADTHLMVAFRLLKDEIDLNYAEEMLLREETPKEHRTYIDMMKDFINQDIERSLLGDSEEE